LDAYRTELGAAVRRCVESNDCAAASLTRSVPEARWPEMAAPPAVGPTFQPSGRASEDVYVRSLNQNLYFHIAYGDASQAPRRAIQAWSWVNGNHFRWFKEYYRRTDGDNHTYFRLKSYSGNNLCLTLAPDGRTYLQPCDDSNINQMLFIEELYYVKFAA